MDHLSNETVLITGIDGFTGQHLAKHLKTKGLKVLGTALQSNDSNIFDLDINDTARISYILNDVRPDYIIHLAAISFVGHLNPIEFYQVNVLGTESILKAIVDINLYPKKILIPSSATVYGNQGVSILDENMIPKPSNHYGCSKLAMEQIANNYFDQLPIIITRPFNYTGPLQSDNFVVPKIVSHFKRREETIELGNLEVFREFNDVRYVTDIYHRLIVSKHDSLTVNICSSKTYSVRNILEMMEDITGHKMDVRINSKFVRSNEIKELKGSNELLNSFIQDVRFYSLKETLSTMVS